MQRDVTSPAEMSVLETPQVNKNASAFGETRQSSGLPKYSTVHISDHAIVQFGDRYLGETHIHLGTADNDRDLGAKIDKSVLDRKYKLLLASLAFLRMGSRHLNISSAMPTTCDWLFGHEKYRSWVDDTSLGDHCGFLWIKGKPGTGKSTTMKVLFEEVKREYTGHLMLSYFFNARAPSELENCGLGLYRSVIHQMLGALPHIRQSFVDRFSSKIDEENYSVSPWTSTELQEFIVEFFRTPASIRAFIFVDALDEGDQQDVRGIVGFLEDLTNHCTHSASGNVVRICFASRHYPLITVKRGISLVLEREPAHADDIRKYVNNKLVIDEEVISSSLSLRIEEKSEHVFLWVVLVVPILNQMHDNGSSQDDLLTHLQTLPGELHDLFDRVLFRDRTNISQTILLYQWLVFAARPLGPRELYSAMTVDSRKSMENEAEPTPAMTVRCLLVWSRGLIEIAPQKPRIHPEGFAVQFIHETVREYFLEGRGMSALDEYLEDNVVGKSHDMLRKYCQKQIDYFADRRRFWESAGLLGDPAFLESLLGEWPSRYAFSAYAIQHIFTHAGRAHQNEITQDEFLWYLDVQGNNKFTEFLRQCQDLELFWRFYYPSVDCSNKSELYILLTRMSGEDIDDLIFCLIHKKLGLDVEPSQFGKLLKAAFERKNTRSGML